MSTFAEVVWASLERGADQDPPRFDAGTLGHLLPPAQRFLGSALPDGVPLHDVVHLSMSGEIKLAGRWLPFTAEQILRDEGGSVLLKGGIFTAGGYLWHSTQFGLVIELSYALYVLESRVEHDVEGAVGVAYRW